MSMRLRSKPIAEALAAWTEETVPKLSRKSELAAAFRYMRARWTALTRCFDDGRIGLDNNSAERALRGVAVGRKNYLFAGSDAGGRRAAAMYSLIETAKLKGLNPHAYLADILARIANHLANASPICSPRTGSPPIPSATPPGAADTSPNLDHCSYRWRAPPIDVPLPVRSSRCAHRPRMSEPVSVEPRMSSNSQ
jgi:hypothetical protein